MGICYHILTILESISKSGGIIMRVYNYFTTKHATRSGDVIRAELLSVVKRFQAHHLSHSLIF